MDKPGYDCAECGLCCIHLGGPLYLYPQDIQRFESEKKTALMERFGTTDADHACPCLTGPPYRCTIYPDRPLVCHYFEIGGRPCRELRAKHGLPV
jgi:Fe-S-cluster containining protein